MITKQTHVIHGDFTAKNENFQLNTKRMIGMIANAYCNYGYNESFNLCFNNKKNVYPCKTQLHYMYVKVGYTNLGIRFMDMLSCC